MQNNSLYDVEREASIVDQTKFKHLIIVKVMNNFKKLFLILFCQITVNILIEIKCFFEFILICDESLFTIFLAAVIRGTDMERMNSKVLNIEMEAKILNEIFLINSV